MSADRLREAARVLRERALDATKPEEMHPYGNYTLPSLPPEAHPEQVRDHLGGTWGDYYATMHPGVGLALADWLDDTAVSHDFSQALDPFGRVNVEKAAAVADLILGGAS